MTGFGGRAGGRMGSWISAGRQREGYVQCTGQCCLPACLPTVRRERRRKKAPWRAWSRADHSTKDAVLKFGLLKYEVGVCGISWGVGGIREQTSIHLTRRHRADWRVVSQTSSSKGIGDRLWPWRSFKCVTAIISRNRRQQIRTGRG